MAEKMTTLVACLSSGKGTWRHVKELIQKEDWKKVFLVTDEFGMKNFSVEKPVEFILINNAQTLKEMVSSIRNQLKDKLEDIEVGVNFVSGSGKEHMALLSALLNLGIGIRLVAVTSEGVEEI